jgi:hypothetical protein
MVVVVNDGAKMQGNRAKALEGMRGIWVEFGYFIKLRALIKTKSCYTFSGKKGEVLANLFFDLQRAKRMIIHYIFVFLF